jgi:hypothetical protein
MKTIEMRRNEIVKRKYQFPLWQAGCERNKPGMLVLAKAFFPSPPLFLNLHNHVAGNQAKTTKKKYYLLFSRLPKDGLV